MVYKISYKNELNTKRQSIKIAAALLSKTY